MGAFIANQVVKAMIQKHIPINGAHVLMLGVTFKENCADVRNTKIVDVVAALEEYGITVTITDPWANPEEVKQEYGIDCHNGLPTRCHSQRSEESLSHAQRERVIASPAQQPVKHSKGDPNSTHSLQENAPQYINPPINGYDAIVLGVAHDEFLNLDLGPYLRDNGIVYDVKGVLKNADYRL